MTDLYARRLKALTVQIAMDDPDVVLELIRQLEMAGDIEPGELRHVESIAHHWREINRGNLRKARR